MENKEIIHVVYLMQLKLNIDGKDRIFKYVGQTKDFQRRSKQHMNDIAKNGVRSSKMFSIVRHLFSEGDHAKNDWYKLNKEYIDKVIKALNIDEVLNFSFNVIHESTNKLEIDCAEKAYQWMLEPQMNSLWSESNCRNIECNVCKHYALFGQPNAVGKWPAKWHWPSKDMFSSSGMSYRRKHLRSMIKTSNAQVHYVRKNKLGWIPKDVKELE